MSFEYDRWLVPAREKTRGLYDSAARRFLRRDETAEKAAGEFLEKLGLRYQAGTYWDPEPRWELAPARLPRIVRALVESGWHIEAEGKIFKRPGGFHMEVSSGVDWFELEGRVNYGETAATLPALLEALRRGDNMVRLDDGTYGLLPEEWLRRIGVLAGAGIVLPSTAISVRLSRRSFTMLPSRQERFDRRGGTADIIISPAAPLPRQVKSGPFLPDVFH